MTYRVLFFYGLKQSVELWKELVETILERGIRRVRVGFMVVGVARGRLFSDHFRLSLSL
jgi:hypothetical protein